MSGIILHHYDASPFSEKIRLLMGYKSKAYPELAYQAVQIPSIMPRPHTIPLTGGYRRTPVLQIGADIYCDTELICRLIDRLYPENSILPDRQAASITSSAHWTDTVLFRICVAMAFQPKALASSPLFSDPQAAEAFMNDRAEFSKGSTALGMELSEAEPYWLLYMQKLDQQLEQQAFMNGDAPTLLDFSTYHCLWFVRGNDALLENFAPFQQVSRWMSDMAQFGHGALSSIEGEQALRIAREASPQTPVKQGVELQAGPKIGDQVDVLPIDYGFQATSGELIVNSLQEIAVSRNDEGVAEIVVHFPRLGFRVVAADK